ncbi:HEPN domain-containing protein [Novosphingobium sp. KN65.2]|uniref:HEPN domain-containing protein n=1 Tax=Novosphingobium sp. KN65.2 TaxID=1478134 RepID=UPI0005DAB319|nr:HEPN domain-containing protein [Novosphingobium sp. KN65.2]CDO38568.1 hypothetical protein SPHV1_620021 [Novosphingobium sp. KN65.2]
MTTAIHQGHVELGDSQLGATLRLEPGRVTLEIASTGGTPNMPERLEILLFTSSTGYFTLTDLYRHNHSMRLGVGGLSTYSARLAFESAHFPTREEIRSRDWSIVVGDIAKILHVNGVIQQMIFPEGGGVIMNYTVSSPPSVPLECPSAGITLRLGQHINAGGDVINGPTLKLTYPADIAFQEEVGVDTALRHMHRIRQLFSLIMGRILPINSATLKLSGEGNPHEVGILGLLPTDPADKPADPLLTTITPQILATLIDRWLSRYEELEDPIRLHMSGLEQRRLPMELRFQIFIQALEALHRRTSPTSTDAIDRDPILATLRECGITSDVVDRVSGVLAHAHEPGLRQRLRHYWSEFEPEITTLRPAETKRSFIGRVAATRNHYAHRTDRDDQVLGGLDLWDATETIKSLSHMALLREIGADTVGIGRTMLDRRFAEYALRE